MFKNKKKLSPVVTCILLTAIVILLSGFLSLLKIQAEYTTVSKVTNELVNNVVEVRNLFSLSGFKHIFTTAVSGFINFEPLNKITTAVKRMQLTIGLNFFLLLNISIPQLSLTSYQIPFYPS